MSWLFHPEVLALSLASLCLILILMISFAIGVRYQISYDRLPAATRLNELEVLVGSEEGRLQDIKEQLKRAEVALSERDQAEAEAEFWRAAVQTAKAEYEALDDQRREIEEVREEYRQALEEITLAEQNLSEKRVELEEAKRRIEQIERNESDVQARSEFLTAEIERQKAEIEGLTQQRALAKDALEEIRLERRRMEEDLENARKAERDARIETERLKSDADTLKAENAALKATREALEQTVIGLGADRGPADGEDPLIELRSMPSCFDKNLPQLPVRAEAEALERLERHLEAVGLRFSRRVLHAFHTCIKIADISPLTVLAGISGTGKSELPRRYAEALGLDFLMVPVQPRWDGPQDLVGFYNYLEKRFKATELARALVRLDGEGWPEFRNSVDDHVVLVLFDEMNLAHVEYYFSDFLSLLEIRRADPRRATIEIDLGLERRFVRLVENMLFVGTMNEDETTQTLSDKVLDRANLLRFARPRMFGETAPAAAEGARKGWLSAKVWKSWQREPSELDAGGHRNQLDSWIATLNDALDRVGRPFGHRVQQALLAYAANHPGVLSRETPVAEAFVDQLEQRILPKLRGVDPQADDVRGGLDDIERLLRSDEDLRDDALLAALERARSQDLFVWSGVQRDT